MKKIPPFEYTRHPNGRCTVSFQDGRHFTLNAELVPVLESLVGTTAIEQAFERYVKTMPTTHLAAEEYSRIASASLIRFGQARANNDKASGNYVWGKIELVRPGSVDFLLDTIGWLFSPKTFVVLFCCSLACTWFGLGRLRETVVGSESWSTSALATIGIVIAATLGHELGHLAACRKHKAKHGGVGFGFYLVFPVFYSNVTGIWVLDKWRRILINLSGVYMELLFICVLLVVARWYPDALAPAILFLAGKLIYTVMPFLRSDGYWVLSDMIEVPNLHQVASSKILDVLKSIRHGDFCISALRGWSNKMFLVYGLANILYIPALFFLGSRMIGAALQAFPSELFRFAESLFHLRPDFTVFGTQSLAALLFYFAFTYYLARVARTLFFPSSNVRSDTLGSEASPILSKDI